MRNRYTYLLAFLLMAAMVLPGCSIQKPLYTKGLHVEWHAKTLKNPSHSEDKVLNPEKSLESTVINSYLQPIDSEVAFIHNHQYNAHEPSLVASSSPDPVIQKAGLLSSFEPNKKIDEIPSYTSERKKGETTHTKIHIQNIADSAPTQDGKKLEVMSLLSMIFSIVGLVTPFIGYALIIAGLVLGIVGLIKIKKNPDAYWGRGFAIAGIAVAGFAILLFLSLLALVGALSLFTL